MDDEFNTDEFIEAIKERSIAAYLEIHEEYVRQSRTQAENLRSEILGNIVAQNFENANNSNSPHHDAYKKWKTNRGGSPLDLVFTGQLLNRSLIIEEIREHDDIRLIGGYEVTTDDTVVIPKTSAKRTHILKSGQVEPGNVARYGPNHPYRAGQIFTMTDLWNMVENAWGKRVKQAAIEKAITEKRTNADLYNRIEKDIMAKHGLSDTD